MPDDNQTPVKICPLCQQQYPEEDLFCGNDGKPLQAIAPVEQDNNQEFE